MIKKISFLSLFFWLIVSPLVSQETSKEYKGFVEPLHKEVYLSSSHGQLTYTTKEGDEIKAGELLFKQDTEREEDQKFHQESDLRKLRAGYEIARLNFQNQIEQTKQRINRYLLNAKIAELRYQELSNGPDKADVEVATEKVKLSKTILENTILEKNLVEKLVNEGHLTKSELEMLEFKIKNEEENLKLAEKELELAQAGPSSIDVQEAKILMEIRKKEYDNQLVQLNAKEKQYEELVAHQEREIKKREKRLEKVIEEIEKSSAFAKNDGTVFFERFHWGEKIDIGRHVWRGLAVRSIADLRKMKVKIKIGVEDVEKFKMGQDASIEVISTGNVVKGRIIKIYKIQEDEFADKENSTKGILGNANKKVFPAELEILDEANDLKPGMSVKVVFP